MNVNVSYRGIQRPLAPELQEKLDAKFAKLAKLVERRGEKEAHVVVTTERHLHQAEVTLNFYDHQLVGLGSDVDLFTALSQAMEKLEKQAVKLRTRWREKTRRADQPELTDENESPAPAVSANGRAPVKAAAKSTGRVMRVDHIEEQRPMTLEEALLEMETGRDYLAFLDAEQNRVSVLVRRRDGNFDLVEC